MTHDGNIELMTSLFEKHLDDLISANDVLEIEDQRPLNQLETEAKKRAEAEFFNDQELKNHGSLTNAQRSPSLIL